MSGNGSVKIHRGETKHLTSWNQRNLRFLFSKNSFIVCFHSFVLFQIDVLMSQVRVEPGMLWLKSDLKHQSRTLKMIKYRFFWVDFAVPERIMCRHRHATHIWCASQWEESGRKNENTQVVTVKYFFLWCERNLLNFQIFGVWFYSIK